MNVRKFHRHVRRTLWPSAAMPVVPASPSDSTQGVILRVEIHVFIPGLQRRLCALGRRGGAFFWVSFFVSPVREMKPRDGEQTATVETIKERALFGRGCMRVSMAEPREISESLRSQKRRGRIEAGGGGKKTNVSENWTELVKILMLECIGACPSRDPITAGSIHVYLFGGLPSGHKVPKSLFNDYRVVPRFRVSFSKFTSHPA